jgi:hypothetical protein
MPDICRYERLRMVQPGRLERVVERMCLHLVHP